MSSKLGILIVLFATLAGISAHADLVCKATVDGNTQPLVYKSDYPIDIPNTKVYLVKIDQFDFIVEAFASATGIRTVAYVNDYRTRPVNALRFPLVIGDEGAYLSLNNKSVQVWCE
jgi:hypothetical protein